MATITAGNFRYTYTTVTNATNIVVTFTKVECNNTSSGTVKYTSGSWVFYCLDAAGASVEYTLSHGEKTVSSKGWFTWWTGSKAVTSYRQTYASSILCSYGGAKITVPVLQSWAISYDSNGGSTAPTAQDKYYGKPLTLTYATPTKTGHSFVNWVCSADSKTYAPGATYSLNQAATMTAQWSPKLYHVSYNSNTGSGYVSSTDKTYGQTAYFSDGTALSKKGKVGYITCEYILAHWNTQPDDLGDSYNLASTIPEITNNITVYAIWQAKYLYPYIKNLQDYRTATSSISDKDRSNNGLYIYISFDFEGCSDDNGETYKIPNCIIRIDDDFYYSYEHDGISADFSLTFTSGHEGSVEFKPSTEYAISNPHNIVITIADPDYNQSSYKATDYITSGIYPIDLHDNPELSEVYMGVMHPYVDEVPLTVPDLFVDGEETLQLQVDPAASEATPATSGYDQGLFNTIRKREWYSAVVDSNKRLKLKRILHRISLDLFPDKYINSLQHSMDLNDYRTNGLYEIGGYPVNGPLASDVYGGQLIVLDSGYMQIFIPDTTGISSGHIMSFPYLSNVYKRWYSSDGGGWSSWIRLGESREEQISLGACYVSGILTSASASVRFIIPTGRVFPAGTTISRITFNCVCRGSNSEGGGVYFLKNASGGTSPTAMDSSASKTIYNGNNASKTITSSMWTKSIQGNTNILIIINGGADYFFSGTSAINSHINNNAATVWLENIQVYLTYPYLS